MILKGTGLKIDIGIGVGGLHCILCNVIFLLLGGGVTFKLNQVLPNQNLTICLFQAQSRFGLVLSRGWVGRWGGISRN